MIFNLRTKEVLGVIESDSTKLVGSYDSVLKINKIGGVCVQGENPSPTNPQEIKKSVVSGIRTHGVQLFDTTQMMQGHTGNFNAGALLPSNNSTDIVFNSNDGTLKGTASGYIVIWAPHKFIAGKAIYNKTGIPNCRTVVANSDGLILSSAVGVYTPDSSFEGYLGFTVGINTEVNGKLLMTYDESAENYEPYMGSEITFTEPVELCGIDDLQDVIEGGKVKRRFTVFKNSGFKAVDGYDVGTSKLMALSIPDNVPNSWSYNNKYSACNKLPAKNVLTVDENGFYVVDFVIYARIKGCSSADEFNAKMADAEFIYPIETETTELLKSKDQMSLNTLQTFDGVTYVEFDSEVQPTINCDYATNTVGAVALSIYAYDEIAKHYVMYNDDGSVRFNGSVNVDEWVIANNLQAYQMLYADSIQTYKGITASTDVTAQNNVVAQNELRGKNLHFTNMGVNGGVAQPVEWVWDTTLARWVLCTVQTQ